MNTTAFRYIGVTDDCVTCQQCGKTELRSTVVLAILDADGNTEAVTYYGSSCAARALGIRGGSRAVLSAARAARDRTLAEAKFAAETLAFYGLPETGEPGRAVLYPAVLRYAEVHADAQWARTKTFGEWMTLVTGMVTRRQAQIAEAALLN